jgi:hypothetical protein
MRGPLIFVSYSHQNVRELRQLKKHLDVLEGVGVEIWSDERINAGHQWRNEIESALENASVGLLLVTAEFLTSKFVTQIEVPAMLQAQVARGLEIFPLIALPCAWRSVPWLERLQVRPRGANPIWGNNRRADTKLAEITSELDLLLKATPEPPSSPEIPRETRRGPSHVPILTPDPIPVPMPSPSIPRIIGNSDSAAFHTIAEQLLPRGKRIVLVGTGLNLLHREPIFIDLAERAARNECTVDICMADPWSPDVAVRLIEEDMGALKPPVGRSGLIKRLASNLHTLDQLGRPANFSLSLFSHYPTFAMCIIDDDYFFYPYGYAMLGNFSPVEHFSKEAPGDLPMITFLENHYKRVRAATVDARIAFDLYEQRQASPEGLRAMSVYFVPAANTPLYAFGSSIMGWDVRQQSPTDTPWQEDAGTAPLFGFHLTIADALFFASEHQAKRVQKEVEMIAANFSRFPLTNLRVASFPEDGQSISILCDDPTRTLEALHFELVASAHRHAVGSNYTFGSAARRDAEAASKIMIERYHAPFILGHFRPHFSLLTKVRSPDRMKRTMTEIQAQFQERVPKQIEMSAITFLQQPSAASPWQIEREIPLQR